MNKAGKHIQTGDNANVVIASPHSAAMDTQRNVINSIMSFLPDNRPISALEIVEDIEKCPKNFTPIIRTFDQDSDADLWRENNILFGRQTTRYLCLSKTEGQPEYVVETLKVIAEKTQPPKEFSLLLRTADTKQKAWRNRKQIIYKLSKRGTVTHAVTDILLFSKLKTAPDGFEFAGEINGILVCYKTGAMPVRAPPPVPIINGCSEAEKALNRLSINNAASTAVSCGGAANNRGSGNWNPNQPLPPVPKKQGQDHDYEEIQTSPLPLRPAPRPPQLASTATNTSGHSVGTLGAYSELDGVPFTINPSLKPAAQFTLPTLPEALNKELDYDFQLERQILCTMKSTASKNPFFK